VLESFGRAPMLLAAALRQLPKRMWLYKPAPDRWSIHQIIVHLADSEASSYLRCRYLIADPGIAIPEFDPEKWASMLGYFHQSTREALEIIRRLRRVTYNLLARLPESVWLHTPEDSERGAMSLDEWIRRQERHIPHHIDQIKQNYQAWLGTHPPRKARTGRESSQPDARFISLSAELC
jgi:DinB superfamily